MKNKNHFVAQHSLSLVPSLCSRLQSAGPQCSVSSRQCWWAQHWRTRGSSLSWTLSWITCRTPLKSKTMLSTMTSEYGLSPLIETVDEIKLTFSVNQLKNLWETLCTLCVCLCVRDASETSKILMDPARDSTNPYVGLAFKLEVRYHSLSLFLHFCLAGRSQCVTLCCFLWCFSLTGGEVWPADVCAGVPGLSEEGGVHLQHAHKQESQSSEACASPRWPDGGENRPAHVSRLPEVTVFHLWFSV